MARSGSNASGSCSGGGFSGTEAIFEVTEAGSNTFTVYSADFDPDLYLRRGSCSGGTELGCVGSVSVGGGLERARLTATLDASAHYLFIDNAGFGDGYALYYAP